ncbi:hypothetical protein GUJ93_ZPchr0004g39913 [Zizania palustris]|uniref:Uncharacterized protein n=1 Tax=Zizania palustris TaxID=103762 RepID=A0A8J5SPK7_ZIZPA|nr:hypothetical protein GUJ93_ZPchr0004g39913 [Zizania palustris]
MTSSISGANQPTTRLRSPLLVPLSLVNLSISPLLVCADRADDIRRAIQGREEEEVRRELRTAAMGFWVTTLIFLLAGVVGSLLSLLCCNRGPSTNLYVLPPCLILRR